MKLHDFGAHDFLNMRNDGIRLDSNTDLYLVGVLRARSSKKKKKKNTFLSLFTTMYELISSD